MDIYNVKYLSESEQLQLFKDCIFVLDTSAICGLYNLTDHYRDIMVKILSDLKERIWIPYQVKVEYLRNRKKSINNPKKERYINPKVLNNKFVDEVRDLISTWEGNKYYHPFMDDDKLSEIKTSVEEANKYIRAIKEVIKEQYDKRKAEIDNIESKDNLLDFVKNLQVGNPFDYCQIKEIVKEGEYRYRNHLPPGYLDEEKEGINKYGDLIIWKGIIDYAKNNNKDIIFICDDLKEDWISKENNGILRNELIAEFYEESNKCIWAYSMIQFIDKLKNQYKSKTPHLPLYDELENVAEVLHRMAVEKIREHSLSGEKIIIRCECGHEFEIWSDDLGFDWESGDIDDRSMGEEIHWEAKGSTECPECGVQLDVMIDAYEYPMMVYNYGTIDCVEGEILNHPDIESICPIEQYYEDKEQCCRCGRYAELNKYGFCEYCQDELDYIFNSDD